jgi:hypothetical protein
MFRFKKKSTNDNSSLSQFKKETDMIMTMYPPSLKTESEKPITALSVDIAKQIIQTLDTIEEPVDINKIVVTVSEEPSPHVVHVAEPVPEVVAEEPILEAIIEAIEEPVPEVVAEEPILEAVIEAIEEPVPEVVAEEPIPEAVEAIEEPVPEVAEEPILVDEDEDQDQPNDA